MRLVREAVRMAQVGVVWLGCMQRILRELWWWTFVARVWMLKDVSGMERVGMERLSYVVVSEVVRLSWLVLMNGR